jgi:hypothetical protein
VQVQRPLVRLRRVATAIAASVATIHLGMFVMIYMLLNQQMQLVNDLGLLGELRVVHASRGVDVTSARKPFSAVE